MLLLTGTVRRASEVIILGDWPVTMMLRLGDIVTDLILMLVPISMLEVVSWWFTELGPPIV